MFHNHELMLLHFYLNKVNLTMTTLFEKLTATTTELIDKYPYAIPITKLVFGLADTITPIPKKEEVADIDNLYVGQKRKDYRQSIHIFFPLFLSPYWVPWALKIYKMTKMDKPKFEINSKREKYGLIEPSNCNCFRVNFSN